MEGDDLLDGAAGDDLLVGEGGKDTLTGGAGSDGFVFSSHLEGIDSISDFSEDDKIVIEPSFGAESTAQFSYDNETGALFFDADSTDDISPVKFATLPANLGSTFSSEQDIVLSGGDTISGEHNIVNSNNNNITVTGNSTGTIYADPLEVVIP